LCLGGDGAMTAAPYGLGESAAVYKLCQLFKANPGLHYHSILIHETGRIEIAADETHGVLMSWSRAMPSHVHHTALVTTQYGLDEADVIEAAGIVVTVRRPLPGAVS
jgi:hypothetical protein